MNGARSKWSTAFWSLAVLASLWACSTSEEELARERRMAREQEENRLAKISRVTALPQAPKHPSAFSTSPAKEDLGRLLFFDPILSGNLDVACATCHHPSHGFSEFRDLSIGVNGTGLGSKRSFREPNAIPIVKRNSQTVLNAAFNGIDYHLRYDPEQSPMFWDLRVAGLEAQVLEPIMAFEEMRGEQFSKEEIIAEVVSRLNENPEYRRLFKEAFGVDRISKRELSQSIAAFERTLITTNSRFDQYMRGEENALSLSEIQGFELFKEVGCANCHNGPMFSDFKIHVIGAPAHQGLESVDSGFQAGFGFRTPSLRNLRFTAPYMHNGTLESLKKVLEFYEDISQGKQRHTAISPSLFDPLIPKLKLSVREMAPIITFLSTLNDTEFDRTIPESVPSGLQVAGNIGSLASTQ